MPVHGRVRGQKAGKATEAPARLLQYLRSASGDCILSCQCVVGQSWQNMAQLANEILLWQWRAHTCSKNEKKRRIHPHSSVLIETAPRGCM